MLVSSASRTSLERGQDMMPIGQTAPRLGPESAELLRLLDLHLSAAEQALTPPQTDDDAQDVQAALAYTDDLFADLVGCWELDGFSAQAVERVRDGLSGHLVAANALAQAGVPFVAILRRAVGSARWQVQLMLRTATMVGAAKGVPKV